MRNRILLVVVAVASLSGVADAHFVLVSPAASLVQNRLGDPQKIAPCGGVSANPTRNTPANPGTPSNAVTQLTGGSTFHLLIQETVFRGPWSVSAAIQDPPMAPVLADGLFAHTERPMGLQEADVQIPNITCVNCLLQVIQFMAEHAKNADGDYSYHHCAVVNITADPAKPIDTRRGQATR